MVFTAVAGQSFYFLPLFCSCCRWDCILTMADSSQCFYCREDLGGKRFVRNEGRPVCVRCHTKFCANSCAECHRPISVETKVSYRAAFLCVDLEVLVFPATCVQLSSKKTLQKISPFSSIRSSATRADTGTRSVSAVQSVTSLWLRSPSAPRMTASCVGSAAPERMLHAATAVINPYWRVRLITFTPMLCRGWPTDLLVLCD